MTSRTFWSASTSSSRPAPLPSGQWRSTPGPSTSLSSASATERAQLLWLPPGLVLQSIAVYATSTAASTGLRFGIRADNNGQPGTLLLDAGTVLADTIGVRSIAITFTVPSTPGSGVPLWLSVTPQGGAVSLMANQVVTEPRDAATASAALLQHGSYQQGSVAGPLPIGFVVSGTASPAPTIAVQAA